MLLPCVPDNDAARKEGGREEGRGHNVRERVRVPAKNVVQSVSQLSLVQFSVGFCVWGAVRCHVSGQSLPPLSYLAPALLAYQGGRRGGGGRLKRDSCGQPCCVVTLVSLVLMCAHCE